MHILDTIGDQLVGTAFRAPLASSASAYVKKRIMDLLQNKLIKVKKSLKNQKTLYRNLKAIVTHLSIATPKVPLTVISLSKDEIVGEEHLTKEELRVKYLFQLSQLS